MPNLKARRYIGAIFVVLVLGCGLAALPQRPKQAPRSGVSAARVLIEGQYEENMNGNPSLKVKFSAYRWFKQTVNETGSVEYTELEGAPVPFASGDVIMTGSASHRDANGSLTQNASFSGGIGTSDVTVYAPDWADTGHGLKVRVAIATKVKGRCSMELVDGSERRSSSDCSDVANVLLGISDVGELETSEKTPNAANSAYVRLEFLTAPATAPGSEVSGNNGVDEAARLRRELEQSMKRVTGQGLENAWMGAVTTGSKEAGYKVTYTGENRSGDYVRKLTMTAQIVPGVPTK